MRPFDGGDRGQQLELGLGLDVDAEDVVVERERELVRGLADAGEHDLLRRHAGRERALQLAARDDVGAGAEPRQRRDHRLVGIRLHRVADERRHIGERARRTRGSAAPASRSNSNRTACRPPRASVGEIDRLGVQHAVAIGEVVHGAALVEQQVERQAFFLARAAASGAALARRVRSRTPAAVLTAPGGGSSGPLPPARRQRQAEREHKRADRGKTESWTANGSQMHSPNRRHIQQIECGKREAATRPISLPRNCYFLPSFFSHFLACAARSSARCRHSWCGFRPSARPTARRTPPR